MSSRHPLRGDPSLPRVVPPRLYPIRNMPPVMIAGHPSLPHRPVMGFLPYNPATLPQQPSHLLYPYHVPRPSERTMVVPAASMVATASVAPVDLRNQAMLSTSIKHNISPHPASQANVVKSSSNQPLDLSVKAKQKACPIPVKLQSYLDFFLDSQLQHNDLAD